MLRDLFSLFPACAGVIRSTIAICAVCPTFPRMCGGDPMQCRGKQYEVGFSPHVRG